MQMRSLVSASLLYSFCFAINQKKKKIRNWTEAVAIVKRKQKNKNKDPQRENQNGKPVSCWSLFSNTCILPILVIIIEPVIFNGCTGAIAISYVGVCVCRMINKTIALIEIRIDIVVIVTIDGVIGICGCICYAWINDGGMIVVMMAMGLGRWHMWYIITMMNNVRILRMMIRMRTRQKLWINMMWPLREQWSSRCFYLILQMQMWREIILCNW